MRFALAALVIAGSTFSGCGRDHEKDLTLSGHDALFIISDDRPALVRPGAGAGIYASEIPQLRMIGIANAARLALPSPAMRRKYGEEACATLYRYFQNNGERYVVDVAKLIAASPTARRHYETLRKAALAYATAHPAAHGFRFVSQQAFAVSIPQSENENWYLALGAYQGFVAAHVEPAAAGGRVTFHYHVWDPYDWDPGKEFMIDLPGAGPIPVGSDFLGAFHRQGLAQEFTSEGIAVELID